MRAMTWASVVISFFKQYLLLDTSSQWEFHLDVENSLGLNKGGEKKYRCVAFFSPGFINFYCATLVVGC